MPPVLPRYLRSHQQHMHYSRGRSIWQSLEGHHTAAPIVWYYSLMHRRSVPRDPFHSTREPMVSSVPMAMVPSSLKHCLVRLLTAIPFMASSEESGFPVMGEARAFGRPAKKVKLKPSSAPIRTVLTQPGSSILRPTVHLRNWAMQ